MESLKEIFEIFEVIGVSLAIGWGFRCGWRLCDWVYKKKDQNYGK